MALFQVGEINFCDKIAFNIKTDNKKKEILEKLNDNYGIKIIKTHCIKYNFNENEKYLNQINKQQQLLYTRTNGNPYYLFLTKLNNINTCMFIDKKIKDKYFYPRIIITHFKFNDDAYNNTIFDGEMIKDNNNIWSYVITNMLVLNDKIVKDNAIEKIKIMDVFLTENYNKSFINICNIYIKKFFSYNNIKDFIDNYIPKLNYEIRGIYFRGLNSKLDILVNFNSDLIIKKDKKIMEHNIDMDNIEPGCVLYNLKKTSLPDVFNIFTIDNKFVDIACVPKMKLSKYLHELFENRTMEDSVLMLFKWNEYFGRFVPQID